MKMMNKTDGQDRSREKRIAQGRVISATLSAKIGFIGIGSLFGVILEAMEDLKKEGIKTQYLQPRTIWPVLEDILDFIDKCSRVYVVELNAQAQLAHILIHQGADPDKLLTY